MKALILIFLLLNFFQAFTQNKTIQTAKAFWKVSVPGTLKVDENGNPVHRRDTTRLIYIETKGVKPPRIDTVWYKGKMFSAVVYKVESPFVVGEQKSNGRKISLIPARGNKLWVLDLTPLDKKIRVTRDKKKIYLKGNHNSRSFFIIIHSDLELRPDLNV